MKSLILCIFAMLVGGVVMIRQDDRAEPEVESLALADLHNVFGGQLACWEASTPACPENANCDDECDGLAVGDACAGDGYIRVNPNYRQAIPSDDGQKDTKTISIAKLCGSVDSCGPVCVDIAFGGTGVTCPSSTVTDYEVETVPDGDDCDETTAMLEGRQRTELVLVANGARFNAFRL